MRRIISLRSLLLLFVLYISLPSAASDPRWQHFYKTVTLGDSFTIDPWNDIKKASYKPYKTSVQTNSDVSAINITEASKTNIKEVYGYTGGVICTYRIDTHKTGEFKIAFQVISYYKQFTSIDKDECYATYHIIVSPKPVLVESISFDANNVELKVGDKRVISATVSPSNAADKSLTWSTDNKTVATVDASGVVEAIAPGQAVITAKANDGSGKTAKCVVTVKGIDVTSVKLSQTTAELEVGKTLTLTATVAPSNATDKTLTWKSSNTSVATVNNGTITAVKEGTANITCTASNGVSASCQVTVKAKSSGVLVTSITLAQNIELIEGQNKVHINTLTPKVLPENATNKNLSWTSSNTKIITIGTEMKTLDNYWHTLNANSAGECTITATAIDGSNVSGKTIVKVKPRYAITLDKSAIQLRKGESLTLKAEEYDNLRSENTHASAESLTWTSSNTNVAIVDKTGKVTAVNEGKATITCSDTINNLFSYTNIAIPAICEVTVLSNTILVEKIGLNNSTLEMGIGETKALVATISPSNATNKALEWSSSNKSVATVDANGKVTAIAAGKATITAKAKDGSNKSATCTVTVKASATEPNISFVSVSCDNTDLTDLKPNDNLKFHAVFKNSGKTYNVSTYLGIMNKEKTKILYQSSTDTREFPSNGQVAIDYNYSLKDVAEGEYYATVFYSRNWGDGKGVYSGNYLIEIKVKNPVISVTSVTLNKTTAELEVGKTLTLTATVTPSNATNKALEWSSSNKAIATVDTNGKVTAVAAGKATITAKAKDGSNKSATCTVTVKAATVSVTSVTLNKTTAELEVGKTLTLTATVAPSNATNKALTWSSSNTSVATVDANGKVTAVAAGNATITAKAKDGSNKSATCAVTVKAATVSVTSVTLNKTTAELEVGGTLTLTATVSPSNATNKALEWSSSNKSIATVDGNGKVTAVAAGNATITAKAKDGSNKSATCAVTVKAATVSVTSVTLNKTTAELEVGGTLILTATVSPSNATNKVLEWSSSNTSVATVEANGKVTAVAAGKATIMAKAKDGSNKSATCSVTVKAATVSVTSVTLNKTTAELEVGGTLTLTATVGPSNATNKALTWSSSNTSIATVDANGKVTAVAAGKATITVKATDGSNKSATCVITVKDSSTPTDISKYSNIIYPEAITVSPESEADLTVKMKNATDNSIMGFQFDLALPTGVSVAKDEDGFYQIELSGDRTTSRKHTVATSLQSNGAIRVVCYSNNNNTFSGKDGAVLNVKLKVDKGIAIGEYPIYLRDVVMTTPTMNNYTISAVVSKLTVEDYKKGDVNGDKTVNVVDVAGVVNLILGNNITGLNKKAADINGDNIVNVVDVAGVVNIILGQPANSRTLLLAPSANKTSLYIDDIDLVPGETKEVKVNLNNPGDAFTGCQFDLYLPKGISIVEEDGYALVDIGSRSNSRKHTVSTSVQPDGAVRVVCYSNNNNTFSGEQGDILTVTLHVANNAVAGNYNLRIGNITLSRTDVTGLTLDDYSARVSIIPTGINNAWAESISNSPVYTVSGQRLKKPRKGINIIDGRKVIVK